MLYYLKPTAMAIGHTLRQLEKIDWVPILLEDILCNMNLQLSLVFITPLIFTVQQWKEEHNGTSSQVSTDSISYHYITNINAN